MVNVNARFRQGKGLDLAGIVDLTQSSGMNTVRGSSPIQLREEFSLL